MVSPLGYGLEEQLKSLQTEFIAAQELEQLKKIGLSQVIGAPVPSGMEAFLNELPSEFEDILSFDPKMKIALAVVKLLKKRATWKGVLDPAKCGLSLGIGQDIPSIENLVGGKNFESISNSKSYTEFLASTNNNNGYLNNLTNPLDWISIHLAEELSLGAFQKNYLTACAASNQSIAFGADSIRSGKCDLVVAGGLDSVLNVVGYLTLLKLGVIAPDNCTPKEICKPFDHSRRGTLIGEGAGLLVLASEEAVKKMKVEPKFELKGWGSSLDGYKVTAPRPDAKGMRLAVERSFAMSGVGPEQIDYVNLHGTGTIANDPLELKMMDEIYSQREGKVSASSTKDRHGHLIAAAGIQEMSTLLLSMENSLLPSNVNLKNPLATEKVDLIQGRNRKGKIKFGVNHSFAFGGVNASLIVENLRGEK